MCLPQCRVAGSRYGYTDIIHARQQLPTVVGGRKFPPLYTLMIIRPLYFQCQCDHLPSSNGDYLMNGLEWEYTGILITQIARCLSCVPVQIGGHSTSQVIPRSLAFRGHSAHLWTVWNPSTKVRTFLNRCFLHSTVT